MWDKEGMKYCWHCMAILPIKTVQVFVTVEGLRPLVGRKFQACSKCDFEILAPDEFYNKTRLIDEVLKDETNAN